MACIKMLISAYMYIYICTYTYLWCTNGIVWPKMCGHTGLENWTRWHNFLVFLVMSQINERIQMCIYLTSIFMRTFYVLNTVLITRHKHTRINKTYLHQSNRGKETTNHINKCHFTCEASTDSSCPQATIMLDVYWSDLILGQLGMHVAAYKNIQLVLT